MSNYYKLAIFFISFTPLWLSVAFLNVLSLVRNTHNPWSEIIGLCCIGVVMTFSISIIIMSRKAITNLDTFPCTLVEVKPYNRMASEFLLTYIFPLCAFDFTQWVDVALFLLYFAVLAFRCIRNCDVYTSLVFEIIGYRFYNCTLHWKSKSIPMPIHAIVICKENLYACQGNTLNVMPLNRPFYIGESALVKKNL